MLLISAVLIAAQPIEMRLYLGTDDESACVRRAFSVSSDEPARTMPPSAWRDIAERHERLREDIAKVAQVTFHELPARLPNRPHYSLTGSEEPRVFGWIPSDKRPGELRRAWHETTGILKHTRYIAQLADLMRQEGSPGLVAWRTPIKYGSGKWRCTYVTYMPHPDLQLYPPYRPSVAFDLVVRMPNLDLNVGTPYGSPVRTMCRDRLLRYMDMGTGLIPIKEN